MTTISPHSGLAGKTIAVTRARHQTNEMVRLIEERGGHACVAPMIQVVWAEEEEVDSLDQALDQLDTYDAVLFTSMNGVHFFLARVEQRRQEQKDSELWRALQEKKLAAVGPKTAQALQERDLQVLSLPKRYKQEDFYNHLQEHFRPGMRMLFPRAKVIRPLLVQRLLEYGIEVDDTVTYQTLPVSEPQQELLDKLRQGEIDALTFTSSSTVRYFDEWVRQKANQHVESDLLQALQSVTVACIGPITARTARQLGFRVQVEAERHTVIGLIEALDHYFYIN